MAAKLVAAILICIATAVTSEDFCNNAQKEIPFTNGFKVIWTGVYMELAKDEKLGDVTLKVDGKPMANCKREKPCETTNICQINCDDAIGVKLTVSSDEKIRHYCIDKKNPHSMSSGLGRLIPEKPEPTEPAPTPLAPAEGGLFGGSWGVLPGDGQCVTMWSNVVSGDFKKAEVRCPREYVIHGCKIHLESGGKYTDGIDVSQDGKTCRLHGAVSGGEGARMEMCCRRRKGTITVISKPVTLTDFAAPWTAVSSRYARFKGPTVDCPKGSKILTCTLHSHYMNYAHIRSQKVEIDGRRCSVPRKCDHCGIQAVCESTDAAPDDKLYDIIGLYRLNDDHISWATCPDDLIVTACKCQALDKHTELVRDVDGNLYTDGTSLSGDGTKCACHGKYLGGPFQARASCGRRKGNYKVVSMPHYLMDYSRPTAEKLAKEADAPIAKCPDHYKPVLCTVHNYYSYQKSYKSKMVAKFEGNACHAVPGCAKCTVMALCLKAGKGAAGCEHEVWSDVVSRDGLRTTLVTCPAEHVISGIKVVLEKGGKYADGPAVTQDGKSALIWGALYGGEGARMRVCCKKRVGTVTVVSKPVTLTDVHGSWTLTNSRYWKNKGPTVDCPIGSKVLSCSFQSYHMSYAHIRSQKVEIDGRRCSVPPKCDYCGIQAVCESEAAAPADKLFDVIGLNRLYDDRISWATCPDDLIVTACKCQALDKHTELVRDVDGNFYTDGTSLSGDGTKCGCHGKLSGGPFQARASCGRRRGDYKVVSKPYYLLDYTRPVGEKWYKEADAPIAKCPPNYEAVLCTTHNYFSHQKGYKNYLKATIDRKTSCHAVAGCAKCTVMALCKGPYK